MNKSTSKSVAMRKEIQSRRQGMFRQIEENLPILVGNVYDVMRRCGKPSCHCAAKPCHRQTLYMYVEKGRRYCKFVRREDEKWVKAAWQQYRKCRKALKEILAINKQELRFLRGQILKRRIRYK